VLTWAIEEGKQLIKGLFNTSHRILSTRTPKWTHRLETEPFVVLAQFLTGAPTKGGPLKKKVFGFSLCLRREYLLRSRQASLLDFAREFGGHIA
jgi:hypothetical protein